MERYTTQKIREDFYLIHENYAEDCALVMGLVIGTEKAALIDSGMGLFGEELRSVVRSLTQKPVINLLTHGHPDHIAGSVLFEDVYMNRRDLDQVPRLAPAKRLGDAEIFSHDDAALLAYAREHCLDCSGFQSKNIDHGDVIDLGGILLEVLKLPGHSMGSLAFYNERDGYVLVGDAFNTRVPASVVKEPSQFAQMAEAIRVFLERIPEETVMYGGHWKEPVPRRTAVDERYAAQEIAAGCVAEDEDVYLPLSPIPNQKRHVHGTVGISYNPAIFAAQERA